MPRSFVKTNTKVLSRIRQDMRNDLRSGSGPARKMLEGWGEDVLAFLRRTFLRNSSGSGSWRPLAPSTLAADKNPKLPGRRLGILRRTSAIFLALFRNRAGNLFHIVGNTIRVGLGGPGRHPGSDITVAGLAMIHNRGNARIPARPIIVEPDAQTVRQMQQKSVTAMGDWMRKAS
jgi:hypothetical protein